MAPALSHVARKALADAITAPVVRPDLPGDLLAEAWAGWQALALREDPGPLEAFVARPRAASHPAAVVQDSLLAPARAALARLRAGPPEALDAERRLATLIDDWLGRLTRAQVRRAEDQTLALTAAAEATRAAQSAFLAHVGHEVRTPVSSILAFTQLLRAQGVRMEPDELTLCLDNLDVQARYLLNLLDDVVELARLDSGPDASAEEDLDLWRLLRDVHHEVRTGPDGRVGGALDITAAVRRYARVDGRRLARALRCVLRTAHRLSPDAELVHTQVDLQPQDELHIQITDGGVEPLEVRQGWFSGFQGANDHQSLGSGVAVAVAARLADCLGGRLSVRSQGQRFVWSLTVPLAELADVATTAETPAAPLRALERLLVVAAPDTPRDLLAELCESLGVEARFVTLDELPASALPRPDVILAEAHPPLTVLERVSATDGLQAIPVVVTGVLGGGPTRSELRRAGVFEVLERPLDLDELTTTLLDAAAFTPE